MFVAPEAPLHGEAARLAHERHPVHAAMASRARDAAMNMNAVIEIDEVRQVVHTRPPQGLPRASTPAHRLEHVGLTPELRMTGHARLRRRHPSERRRLDGRVAVATIDAETPYVMFMAERNRLLHESILLRAPRRARQSDRPRNSDEAQRHAAIDDDP